LRKEQERNEDRKELVQMVAEHASDGELVIGIDCWPYSWQKEQLDYEMTALIKSHFKRLK